MKRLAAFLPCLTAFLAGAILLPGDAAAADTTLRVGWCVRSINDAIAPFAVATKMGWFHAGGIKVEIVPLPGSSDCVKYIGTHELPFAIPSVEPVATFRPTGIMAKVFYTAYQGNIYSLAVPAASPIKTIEELKGARIGVNSIASAATLLARALVTDHGMNPDQDVSIVVAGEGAQTVALLRSHQVDALSQYDMQYAFIENSGIPLRQLDTGATEHFPGNGFIALEETLRAHRDQAVALAQGYAKGTIFAISNPEAALRILWELYPQSKPVGEDEATALKEHAKVLGARIANWRLEKGGVHRWGESNTANYQAYLDFLQKWGVVKQPTKADEVVTNDLLPEIDAFDPNQIAAQAKAYGGH